MIIEGTKPTPMTARISDGFVIRTQTLPSGRRIELWEAVNPRG